MRLFCFSDVHRQEDAARRLAGAALGANPSAIISAGDLGMDGEQSPGVYEAFRRLDVPVLAVPGNHDGTEAYPAALAAAGWRNLDDQVITLDGWVLAGHGFLVNDERYYGPDSAAQLEVPSLSDLLARLETCPADRLVLVSHLPPHGTLAARDRRFVDRGSAQLRRWIEVRQPAAVLCGHVHHREAVVERLGETLVVNAGPHGWLVEL